MKKILNVSNLKTEEDKQKIEEQLAMTSLVYTVSLANQCVVIEGDGDALRVATHAVMRAGFQVK